MYFSSPQLLPWHDIWKVWKTKTGHPNFRRRLQQLNLTKGTSKKYTTLEGFRQHLEVPNGDVSWRTCTVRIAGTTLVLHVDCL